MIFGPMLDLGRKQTPDWLYLWEGDVESVESYLLDHVRALVQRYLGKTHVWVASARMNCPQALTLSEEQRLRLTVSSIDAVRKLDVKTPVVIAFDQPWGDYLGRGEWDLSPLHFADALVRAELGVSGIGLEINWGYWPGGTPERDLLEIVRLIDRWSSLNLPLIVFLTVPSDGGVDPQAAMSGRAAAARPNAARQLRDVQQLVNVIASKPWVHGVVWRQVRDAAPHDFPHGGLFDHADRPKPALQALAAFRKENLV